MKVLPAIVTVPARAPNPKCVSAAMAPVTCGASIEVPLLLMKLLLPVPGIEELIQRPGARRLRNEALCDVWNRAEPLDRSLVADEDFFSRLNWARSILSRSDWSSLRGVYSSCGWKSTRKPTITRTTSSLPLSLIFFLSAATRCSIKWICGDEIAVR